MYLSQKQFDLHSQPIPLTLTPKTPLSLTPKPTTDSDADEHGGRNSLTAFLLEIDMSLSDLILTVVHIKRCHIQI